jgi:hypothetical protein
MSHRQKGRLAVGAARRNPAAIFRIPGSGNQEATDSVIVEASDVVTAAGNYVESRWITSHRGSRVPRRYQPCGAIHRRIGLVRIRKGRRDQDRAEQAVEFSLDRKYIVQRVIRLGRADGQRQRRLLSDS